MIAREEVLAELKKLGVVLKDGSVYEVKTLCTVSFDFYDEEGRKGLKLAWSDASPITAKILARAIRDLRHRAIPLDQRAIWLPPRAIFTLRLSDFDNPPEITPNE